MHFILTTHGTGGDVYPFVRLGAALRRRGLAVSIATHRPFEARVRAAGLGFAAIDSDAEYAAMNDDLATLVAATRDYDRVLSFWRRHQSPARLRRELEVLRGLGAREGALLIARHHSSLAALLAAETWGTPIASVVLAPLYLNKLALDEALFGPRMAASLEPLRAELGLPPIREVGAWMTSPPVTLAFWPEWFAPYEPAWPAGILFTGFPNDAAVPPGPAQVEGGAGAPRVVVTGGTSRLIRPDFYRTAVEGCARARVETLVVTPYRSLLPDRLPAGVRWEPSIDLDRVMPSLGAIVHHGGIGTLSSALLNGTPQLLVPHEADRPDNAKRLAGTGVFRVVAASGFTPEAVAAELAALLAPEYRSRCERFAENTEGLAGVELAADRVHELAQRPELPRLNSATFAAPPQTVGSPPRLPSDCLPSGRVAALEPEQRQRLLQRVRASRRSGATQGRP